MLKGIQDAATFAPLHNPAHIIGIEAAKNDLIAASGASSQAYRRHGGFSTRAGHAHHLHGGEHLADQIRHGGFNSGRGTKREQPSQIYRHCRMTIS